MVCLPIQARLKQDSLCEIDAVMPTYTRWALYAPCSRFAGKAGSSSQGVAQETDPAFLQPFLAINFNWYVMDLMLNLKGLANENPLIFNFNSFASFEEIL